MKDSNDQIRSGYVVLVEWDGNSPPTTWYNRLHAYGLWVRGDKDTSVLSRRESTKGVVFQEGAVVVNSQSFAHLLAATAVDMGAKTVSVGLMDVERYSMSGVDLQVFEKITSQTSKRGPKTHKDEGTYTITCFEEARTFEAELRDKPMVCPECGGFHIQWRKGKVEFPSNVSGNNLENIWLATRWNDQGHFEIRPYDPKSRKTLKVGAVRAGDVKAIEASRQFAMGSYMGTNLALRAMDIAYCITTMDDPKSRLDRRVKVLKDYYQQGGTQFYPMACPKDLDMVDIAGVDDNFIKFL